MQKVVNGLNTVEVTSVDAASAPFGFLSIAEDKYIPGFKKLNDAVHEAGGKTCLQLWQGGLAVGTGSQVLTTAAFSKTLSGSQKNR